MEKTSGIPVEKNFENCDNNFEAVLKIIKKCENHQSILEIRKNLKLTETFKIPKAEVSNINKLLKNMMMMMMNRFCGMVDRLKAISVISSRDHCQRSSPSRISDTPRARFEPAQNLSSGFVERSCAVAITTTPGRHEFQNYDRK